MSKKVAPKRGKKSPSGRRKPGRKPGVKPENLPKLIEAGKATQFQPGVSGNPSGVSRAFLISQAYKNKLKEIVPGDRKGRTGAEIIADRVFAEAEKGSHEAAVEITNRTEGKPMQNINAHATVEVSATDKNISELSDKELAERIEARIAARNREELPGAPEEAKP